MQLKSVCDDRVAADHANAADGVKHAEQAACERSQAVWVWAEHGEK